MNHLHQNLKTKLLASLALVLFLARAAFAAEPSRQVFLQVPSIDTGTAVLYLYGKHKGLFTKEGLDLRILVAKPHLATPTLVSGDTHFSGQFQSCFYAGLRGLPVKSIMTINSKAPFHFLVRPEITTFEALKGKSIGVASLGTATHYAAKKAVAHFGLNADRDVTYLGLGSLQTRLNAFETKTIHAAILSAPWHSLAVKMGGRDLLFVGDIVDIVSGGLCTTDKMIKEQPALVKSMIRASLHTMQAARETRAEAIAFWSQTLKLDTARATAMFDEIPKTMSPNGLLSDNGLQALLEAGRLFGAVQGNVDPDRGLDMTLLRQTLKEMGIK
jgi:NitT/TauT family transport system substrate-binding protein